MDAGGKAGRARCVGGRGFVGEGGGGGRRGTAAYVLRYSWLGKAVYLASGLGSCVKAIFNADRRFVGS